MSPYIIISCLCTYSIGSHFQPESIGALTFIINNFPSIIIIIVGPFVVCLPDIIIKQISFNFFPNPADYLKIYQKDENYKRIMENKNMSTTNNGVIVVRKISRRLTQGVKNLQERIQELRNKANSTMDVNLINKLKLDFSSNLEYHENSINPLNNMMKNRLPLGRMKKKENTIFIEKQQTNKNYEYMFQNNQNNNMAFFQGPNDVIDKVK